MKRPTRILVLVGTLLVLPLALLTLLPVLFRDRIAQRVKTQVHSTLDARIDWREVGSRGDATDSGGGAARLGHPSVGQTMAQTVKREGYQQADEKAAGIIRDADQRADDLVAAARRQANTITTNDSQ